MIQKKDKTQIDHWLQQQKEKNLISDFEYNQFLEVSAKSVSVKRGQQKETIENQGANLYLSTMDVDYSKVYDDFWKTFLSSIKARFLYLKQC